MAPSCLSHLYFYLFAIFVTYVIFVGQFLDLSFFFFVFFFFVTFDQLKACGGPSLPFAFAFFLLLVFLLHLIFLLHHFFRLFIATFVIFPILYQVIFVPIYQFCNKLLIFPSIFGKFAKYVASFAFLICISSSRYICYFYYTIFKQLLIFLLNW